MQYLQKLYFAYDRLVKKAAQHEIDLHNLFDIAVNPNFYNKAKATSTGFDTSGITLTNVQRQLVSETSTGRRHSRPNKRR